MLAAVLEPEIANIGGYRAVVDAIAARDPARAGTAARALLAPATDALLEMCAALIADDPEERDG